MADSKFSSHALVAYFFVLYLFILGIVSSFMSSLAGLETGATIFVASAFFAYSFLYLLPTLFLTKAVQILTFAKSKPAGWKTLLVYTTACLSGTSTVLFLAADRYLFSLYGYHFNAFVWNLITTTGGIDSLGNTLKTEIWLFAGVSIFFILSVGLLRLLFTSKALSQFVSPPRRYLVGGFILLGMLFLVEEGCYAYFRYISDDAYLKAANVIPFHLETSAKGFFLANGVPRPTRQARIRLSRGQIHYPDRPLQISPVKKHPNIVWLTAESFRWDLLSEEVTPNLWKFSRKAVTFNQHYSGGNRTRMGMFSMFYGLYSPYWYGFQEQKIRPQLMQQIADNDYQMAIHTSQSFSYPELKDTLFAQIPTANMQELQSGPSWQRDHQNISDINQFIRKRDPHRPFFAFMFFESTHAPYNFPETAVIRDDYIEEVNYLDLNKLVGDIEKLHNRYINAAHHVDAEVGRILNILEQDNLLEDTIVLFTGDHGEEFMETGHWGHGHDEVFPETQIRVPLVLWLPGKEAQVIDYPTSHNQIPATLMPYLGVVSPPLDYSSEEGLFTSPRPYRVIGSYNYLAVIDSDIKVSFPYTKADYFHYIITDRQDRVIPLQRHEQLLSDKKAQLDEVLAECKRFTLKTKTVALRE